MTSLRARLCAVAAALLCPLLLTTPAIGDDLGSYVVSGEPIAGQAQQSPDAPLLSPGQWTDALERGASDSSPGTVRYYRVPTPAGSVVRISALMPMPQDRDGDGGSIGLRVELFDLDGTSCTSETATEGLAGSGPDFVVAALSYRIDPEKDCGSRENLHVRVERTQDGLADRTLPVEITVRLEPAADTDALPEPVEEEGPTLPIPVLGTAASVSGGNSFTDAAALTSGATYADTLRTGDMLFYRVPMTWGQRLTYLVRDTGPTTPVRDRAETVSVAVLNPMRDLVSHVGDSDSMFNSKSTVLTASTDYPVEYRNRENSGNSRELSISGDFYLVVTAMPRDGVDEPDTSTTIELTVVVSGDPGPEPAYLDLGLPTSSGPSGSVAGSADATTSAASDTVDQGSSTRAPIESDAVATSSSGPAPVTWWAVGGIVVVAGGVILLLLRRRPTH